MTYRQKYDVQDEAGAHNTFTERDHYVNNPVQKDGLVNVYL